MLATRSTSPLKGAWQHEFLSVLAVEFEAGEFVARVDGFVHRPVQPQRRVERVERIVVGLGERADVLLFALA